MTQSLADTRAARMLALARHSVEAAVVALAQLCGEAPSAVELRVCTDSVAAGADKFETGIVFEADGAVRGLVALLFSCEGRAAVLAALGAEHMADSALREVGNIVASHSVSAAADRLAGRVTLSVPTLVSEDAGAVVDGLLARRADSLVTFTTLRGSDAAPEVVMVFAAEAR